MSIYFPGDEELMNLVRKVVLDHHPDLDKAKVLVGVTFAMSSKESQPALREHGQATWGFTKIVPPKDRIRKSIDVELWIDADQWGADRIEHKLAKLDNLLTRVEIKKPKPKKKKKTVRHGSDDENAQHEESEFLTDAGGRPLLKMRKPDLFVSGGFCEVIQRHGQFAPEYLEIERAKAMIPENKPLGISQPLEAVV